MEQKRDFLDLNIINPNDLKGILAMAHAMKSDPDRQHGYRNVMPGKRLVFISEKPSTRTRFSFRAAIEELGGTFDAPPKDDIHLGENETIKDTARVLSNGLVDVIVLRTFEEAKLHELARHSSVPVVNGLTNESHPCQVMADIMTMQERLGNNIEGEKIVWAGDGNNNVLNSLIHAAPIFGFELQIICPRAYSPHPEILREAKQRGGFVTVSHDIAAALYADVVFTDVWASMQDKDELQKALRIKFMSPYQVNTAFMAMAKPDAFVMHCMPANRGQEITDEVMDGPQSAVWDEALNRLHVQKAILRWCLNL
ncbi:MAG: ornithine carbamoyltransferase [Alphaproteobacteria bacterium]|nr:ornithine carbamoyltransferase [Alphaproteobacteria bacterium]